MRGAQIGTDHVFIVAHLIRGAIANLLAVIENNQALTNSHDLAQIVFNEHNGQTLLVDFGDGGCQGAGGGNCGIGNGGGGGNGTGNEGNGNGPGDNGNQPDNNNGGGNNQNSPQLNSNDVNGFDPSTGLYGPGT